jgi:hypothetical protein
MPPQNTHLKKKVEQPIKKKVEQPIKNKYRI